MKLETEPVCHPLKVSRSSSSKLVEYDHHALDSVGLNTVEKTMKENGNGHLFSQNDMERDADQLLCEKNVANDEWMPSSIEHSVCVDDSDNAKEVTDQGSAVTLTHSMTETKFGKDLHKFYMDKGVVESQRPEDIVCYKESTEHVVKDICIDEVLPCMDKIVFEDVRDEIKSGIPCPHPENKYESELTKEVSEISTPIPEKIEQKDTEKQCDLRDLALSVEAKCGTTGKIADNNSEEMISPVEEMGAEKSNGNSEACKGDEVKQETTQISDGKAKLSSPAVIFRTEELSNGAAEALPMTRNTSGSEDSGHITPSRELSPDKMEESSYVNSDSDSSAPAASSGGQTSHNELPKTLESHITSGIEDKNADSRSVSKRIQNGLGETSFSMSGPFSGRLNYVDPVPYSGSLSMRSDSSTTSARSFAFPVLQSEWNSSPVRMAKADRRHRRGHGQWRSLLCCKF